MYALRELGSLVYLFYDSIEIFGTGLNELIDLRKRSRKLFHGLIHFFHGIFNTFCPRGCLIDTGDHAVGSLFHGIGILSDRDKYIPDVIHEYIDITSDGLKFITAGEVNASCKISVSVGKFSDLGIQSNKAFSQNDPDNGYYGHSHKDRQQTYKDDQPEQTCCLFTHPVS